MCSVPTDGLEPLFHIKVDVEKHRTKKNGKSAFFSRKTGRAWITMKPEAKQQEQDLVLILTQVKQKLGQVAPLNCDIHAEFIFTFDDYYTKDKKRRKTLPDLSNLIELPQDALQKAGIIENDTQICYLDGSCRKPGAKNTLEIYLWPVDDFL